MKRILKNWGLALVAALVITACDEKLKVLESSNYGVKFKNEQQALTESVVVIDIPVSLAAPKQSGPVDITYEVSGTASEGPDYTFNTTKGTVTIPAGEFTASIKINLLQDVAVEATETILLTIKTVSGGLKAGIGNSTGTTFSVSITDDDCPYVQGDYIKLAAVRETYGASCYPPGCTATYPVQITSGGVNTFVTDNFWDSGWVITFTVNPTTLVITVPTQSPAGGVTVSGSGTLSTCTKTMTFDTLIIYPGYNGTNGNIYKF